MPAQDESDRLALRRNVRWLLLVASGVCVLGVTAGIVVGVLANGSGDGRGHHPLRAALLIAGLVVVAVGVMAVTLVVFLRHPVYRRVLQYGFGERRRVWKAVKSGRPLSPRETQVAAASRDYLRRFRWAAPVGAVFLELGWVVQGLDRHGSGRWLWWAVAAAYVPLLALGSWQWRRNADRYDQALSRSPAPEGS